MRYYIDGKLENETRLNDSSKPILERPGNRLVIGNMSRLPFIDWTDMYFNGLVDEVYLFNRALSAEEVMQLAETPNK